ncbi:glycosyltransferase [Nocardioides cheoyonin]|uniref:glycosyltransferase n=1 Tax=Nocardioides cheoyonin TaxID=3156615 RepID=UPI0032B53598
MSTATTAPTPAPTLSIGLPTYNGERFLAQALDDLLAQTFTDLEVIVSDNASTDRTGEIAQSYAARDPRVRYVRQPVNLGAAGNHNAVLALARGRYFAYASDDDRYAPTLYERCLDVLEADPGLALVHSADGFIDEEGRVIAEPAYLLDTAASRPSDRFRSVLLESGGNDFYAVGRTETFRRIRPLGGYHQPDRVMVASLALQGRFQHLPEVLYHRRDHPGRGERATSRRARAAGLDPRRANRWLHPMPRLYAEYVGGLLLAVRDAPIGPLEKARCLRALAGWLLSRVDPRGRRARAAQSIDPAVRARDAGRAVRVTAFGYLGIGNQGNEASLEALHAWADRNGVALSALCVDPAEVTRTHGIPATRIMSYRRDLASGSLLVTAMKAGGRLLDIPRIFRAVGRTDAVVVPGSGTLESGLQLPPWGLPYWLFVLAVCCRLRGRRLALLNIGAEVAKEPVTRFFHRWTARLAHVVSVRDERSRQAVRTLGVRRRVDVAADLVFGLPTPAAGPVRPGHVVVGVMAYYGGPDTPDRGPAVLARFEAAMADFCRGLLEEGRTVTLVTGDDADRPVAERVAGLVGRHATRTAGGPHMHDVPRPTVSPATTLAGVMAETAQAEVVVAARFHTLVAGLATCRPTVSLGYAPKAADLLARFGLTGVSQRLDAVDPALLRTQIERVVEEADEPRMKETCRRLQEALDDQWARLSDALLTRRGGSPHE